MTESIFKNLASRSLKSEGYAPESWTNFFETSQDIKVPKSNGTFRIYETRASSGPLFVLHHGGGHTALSWVLVASFLRERTKGCSVLCFDCRGHGDTQTSDDGDLSLERLSEDMGNLIDVLYGDKPPDTILVGHRLVDISSTYLLDRA